MKIFKIHILTDKGLNEKITEAVQKGVSVYRSSTNKAMSKLLEQNLRLKIALGTKIRPKQAGKK